MTIDYEVKTKKNYKGAFDCMMKILSKRGIQGFYQGGLFVYLWSKFLFNSISKIQGVGIAAVSTIPNNALLLGSYEYIKSLLEDKYDQPMGRLMTFLVSFNCVFFSSIITYPLETMMRAQMVGGTIFRDGFLYPKHDHGLQCFGSILSEHGIKGKKKIVLLWFFFKL